ncbi:expressed protein [Echinococcus multilocularis]|uniref:Expressed protein n=1 Tax=Echinococcus multilocularis TaxID=6211 RepID=A0A068Y7T8_ECHMU|nr:expressed protein [Echinococcus multilocularis]
MRVKANALLPVRSGLKYLSHVPLLELIKWWQKGLGWENCKPQPSEISQRRPVLEEISVSSSITITSSKLLLRHCCCFSNHIAYDVTVDLRLHQRKYKCMDPGRTGGPKQMEIVLLCVGLYGI